MTGSRLTAARRWRLRIGATLALWVAIAGVIAILLGTRSPASPHGSSGHDPASGSTTVQRRDLVQTDTESGTLSYANPQTVYNRLSGTVTWLPSVGQVIKPGQALYRVANEPVILMNGRTPAYRDLSSSDGAGPDILELNRNLVALGFDAGAIVVDDEWQAATTSGVELFQASLGETATGKLTLGRVVFLPGAQLVSTVSATLGSGGGASAGYHPPAGGASPEFASLTSTTGSGSSPTPSSGTLGVSTTPSPTTPKHSCPPKSKKAKKKTKKKPCGQSGNPNSQAALTALLRAEIADLKAEQAKAGSPSASGSGQGSGNSGGHGSENGNGSGGGGGSATAILQTSSTQLVATVDLDATKQSEAKVGEPVTVELPNGDTVDGKVIAVSPVAQSSSDPGNSGGGGGGNGGGGGGAGGGGGNNGNGSSGATVPVTITLSGHRPGAGLDQAAVSVNFAQAKANNVLSVPVTALLATAGGSYAVEEAAAPHRLIPVTTGLFAAGYVEISGPGIYAGLQVTDSQG